MLHPENGLLEAPLEQLPAEAEPGSGVSSGDDIPDVVVGV